MPKLCALQGRCSAVARRATAPTLGPQRRGAWHASTMNRGACQGQYLAARPATPPAWQGAEGLDPSAHRRVRGALRMAMSTQGAKTTSQLQPIAHTNAAMASGWCAGTTCALCCLSDDHRNKNCTGGNTHTHNSPFHVATRLGVDRSMQQQPLARNNNTMGLDAVTKRRLLLQ